MPFPGPVDATAGAIIWPAAFDPGCSPIHVVNQLDTAASPDAVWAVLIRAARWPAWYPNAHAVRIQGGGPDLCAGTGFTWRTFGVSLRSTVEEFVPAERIAWTAAGFGVRAYHAWLIQPTPSGSRIRTEETQHGWLARAGMLLVPLRMARWHQRWLEALSAEAGGSQRPDAAAAGTART